MRLLSHSITPAYPACSHICAQHVDLTATGISSCGLYGKVYKACPPGTWCTRSNTAKTIKDYLCTPKNWAGNERLR